MPALMLGAYLHDLDPIAIGPIRWYGLAYIAGFLVGYALLVWLARRRATPVPHHALGDLVVTIAIGTVLGGRIGYVVFYQPQLLWQWKSDDPPFWGLLAIDEGGMASHGAMIGMLLGGLWFAWRTWPRAVHLLPPDEKSKRATGSLPASAEAKKPSPAKAVAPAGPAPEAAPTPAALRMPRALADRWLHAMDLVVLLAPLGVIFGRLANFINGELYGRPTSPDFPLAVKFPQEMREWGPERLQTLANALREQGEAVPSRVWEVVPSLIERIQAGDERVRAAVEPLLAPRHPSQLYAAALEGLAVFLVMMWLYRRPRRPGVLLGAFCITYAVVRVIGEVFREPDAHLGLTYGLSRGQWLSILLLLIGVAITVFAARRDTQKLGGWLRPSAAGPAAAQVPDREESATP